MNSFGGIPQGATKSIGNTTTTLLASGATYTGTGEQNDLPHVMVYAFSNISGTLYFDWSVNGTDWHSFPTSGFTVSASTPEFHTAVKGGRYFRVRFVMDAGTQTAFRLTTYYGYNFLPSNAPIGNTIATDADAILTKSVISGVGNTTATVTNHRSLQVTPPREGKAAFGDMLVAQSNSVIQLNFSTTINSRATIKRENQSGTVTHANGMAVASTGASANSSAELTSVRIARYHPGQGVRAKFTGLFTTGVANSTQGVGIGISGNGFFFGYNGTAFGILHRRNGVPEIRTLTVSTASSTAENITITLDGDSTGDVVAVTNSGNTTTTANEIAAHDYSDVGRGWTAKAVGSTVIFTSWNSAPRTGTYSLSSATTAVGTFARTLAGVTPTQDWIAQANWNGADTFNGSGPTGVTLDPTKGNVFQIVYQYLGFGSIAFFIEDPNNGEMHLVHSIAYANANTTPSLGEPSLPLCMFAENTSNTTNIVVKSASMAEFVDGDNSIIGSRRSIQQNVTLGATSSETPFLTIRNTIVFNSKLNSGSFKLLIIGASAEHTKPVELKFYSNATLTNASFSDVETNVSILQKDISATAFTGGTLLFVIPLGKTGNNIVDITEDTFSGVFTPGDTLTVTIAPKSGNAAEATVSLNIVELF